MVTTTGQASERNLVNLINKHASKTDPLVFRIGNTSFSVVAAAQLGGGSPEPKADIKLVLSNGKEVGISMKKPNFGFFESWMNKDKTYQMLLSVGIEEAEANLVVTGLVNKAIDVSKSDSFKSEVLKEHAAMTELIGTTHPIHAATKTGNKFNIENFKVSPAISQSVNAALLKDKQKRFGTGTASSSFKIENVYIPLKELLGSKYKDFLKKAIGGGSNNPFKADYVLVGTFTHGLSKASLINELKKMQSISYVVDKYNNDDTQNIKFRLRPITSTRASYSKTNAGKYKKGAQFYADETIGVSWTVHISK
jgi:hypothetical protein